MTSHALEGVRARDTRPQPAGELAQRLRRQLAVRHHEAEFDRALESAGPTMRNELLAIREDLRRS